MTPVTTGRAPTVVQRPTFLTTVPSCPFVTAHNELDHLIADNLDLQFVVTTTMATAHEMHAHFNTSVCHARGPIHESPVQTGDLPLTNSEAMHTLHTLQLGNTLHT